MYSNGDAFLVITETLMPGADPQILKGEGGALYRPPWLKILGFRWSKKAKIALETVSFSRNISISTFNFSPFLCTMKACQ